MCRQTSGAVATSTSNQQQAERDRQRDKRRRQREARTLAGLVRERAVIDDLADRADDPVWWAAVKRQGCSCLRHLETYRTSSAYTGIRDELDTHRDRLLACVGRAERALDDLAAGDRTRAEQAVGLRLAVIGKGGAGKTVVSSTLARLLSRRGRHVLAVDLDTNPGLSYSIGLGDTDITLPDEASETDEDALYGWRLRSDLLPRQAVERFAVRGPDGVAVTGLGKIADPDKDRPKRTLVAILELLRGFGEPGWDVIADLEAGPTTPFEWYHAFADHVAIVVGPPWRSAMTARRLLPLVGDGRTTTVVGNRFREEPDHPGLPADVRIPFDPAVAEAERRGLAPLDACPDSPAVTAVEALVDAYLTKPVPATTT